MRWRYKLLEHKDGIYRYAYSHESDELDGVMVYDANTEDLWIEKAAAKDTNKFFEERSISHFYFVIKDGFPDERSVCCG